MQTLKTFPGAVLILAGCVALIQISIYLTVYSKKSDFALQNREEPQHELELK